MADYRIFVGAFPGGDLAERIQHIRQQYDPKTARITPPHVTMAGTYWRSGPATPENEKETVARLEAAQAKIHPFELRLGGIKSFSTRENPVVYLDVELTTGLLAARQALVEILGKDKHGSHFSAHMTLAMRLDQAAAARMLAELKDSEWNHQAFNAPILELRLMQRGANDPAWRVIGQFPLS